MKEEDNNKSLALMALILVGLGIAWFVISSMEGSRPARQPQPPAPEEEAPAAPDGVSPAAAAQEPSPDKAEQH